jgi:hypothetical protein
MTKTENKTYNLSAYFMLPLLKLSPSTFDGLGNGNLENVYITTQMQVVVRVKHKEEVAYEYINDPNFILDYDEDGLTTIVYELPDVFGDDFLYYTKGMYSKMTIFAKDEIKKLSGLVFKKKVGDKQVYDSNGKKAGTQPIVETHSYLRALDLDPVLREHMEQQLDIKISDKAELLDKITEKEFIKL